MKTNLRRVLIFLIPVLTSILWANLSSAENNFISIPLPKGIKVELPKNWVAISNNKRIVLDTFSQSVVENNNMQDVEHDLAFVANYDDDHGKFAGGFIIRYYPTQVISQTEARSADATFIRNLDLGLHREVGRGIELAGGRLLAWKGTTKQVINNATYFVSEYRQSSPQKDKTTRTRLVRLFNAQNSFTIIISYREDQEYFLKPISNKILNSVRVN